MEKATKVEKLYQILGEKSDLGIIEDVVIRLIKDKEILDGVLEHFIRFKQRQDFVYELFDKETHIEWDRVIPYFEDAEDWIKTDYLADFLVEYIPEIDDERNITKVAKKELAREIMEEVNDANYVNSDIFDPDLYNIKLHVKLKTMYSYFLEDISYNELVKTVDVKITKTENYEKIFKRNYVDEAWNQLFNKIWEKYKEYYSLDISNTINNNIDILFDDLKEDERKFLKDNLTDVVDFEVDDIIDYLLNEYEEELRELMKADETFIIIMGVK